MPVRVKPRDMTLDELIGYCTGDFYRDFAREGARRVAGAGAQRMLWCALRDADRLPLKGRAREKFLFRASYILECLYFTDAAFFDDDMRREFFVLFPAVANGSMRRHFAKICRDLVAARCVVPDNAGEVCRAAADWVADTGTRIAVKNHAVAIVSSLAGRVEWAADVMPDLLAILERDSSPGAMAVLRRMGSGE